VIEAEVPKIVHLFVIGNEPRMPRILANARLVWIGELDVGAQADQLRAGKELAPSLLSTGYYPGVRVERWLPTDTSSRDVPLGRLLRSAIKAGLSANWIGSGEKVVRFWDGPFQNGQNDAFGACPKGAK
jgi:hypothetical protein